MWGKGGVVAAFHRVSLERKMVTSWVVRSAKNKNECPKENRVHTGFCMTDVGTGAGGGA